MLRKNVHIMHEIVKFTFLVMHVFLQNYARFFTTLHIQELIANQNKPQIPVSAAKRRSVRNKIIKERLGKPYQELLKKYTVIPEQYLYLQTDFCSFTFFAVTDTEKSNEGYYLFKSNIFWTIKEEYRDSLTELIPSAFKTDTKLGYVRSDFLSFYGLSNEVNPNIKIEKSSDGIRRGYWLLTQDDYDEWVRLIEAAADMMMYYLPHIGTVDDFIKFIKAHDVGETNFAELTLPETNPALREFFAARYLTDISKK